MKQKRVIDCNVCHHRHEQDLSISRLACVNALQAHLNTIYRDPEFMQQPCRFWTNQAGELIIGYLEHESNFHYATLYTDGMVMNRSSCETPEKLVPMPFTLGLQLFERGIKKSLSPILLELPTLAQSFYSYLESKIQIGGQCPECNEIEHHLEGCPIKGLLDQIIKIVGLLNGSQQPNLGI